MLRLFEVASSKNSTGVLSFNFSSDGKVELPFSLTHVVIQTLRFHGSYEITTTPSVGGLLVQFEVACCPDEACSL